MPPPWRCPGRAPPLLRRCDLEWPDIPEAADSTQYLLGDDLLVAPILDPAREGSISARTVWIPPGEWQDLWTGRTHRGPATIGAACALGEYPVFVRRGGLVLTAPQRESTGIAVWPEVVADAFVPQADLAQTRLLYEDDGCSIAYAQGACALTEFTLQQQETETGLSVIPRPAPEGIRPDLRTLTIRVHLPQGTAVRSVQLDGRALDAAEYVEIEPIDRRASTLFAGPGTPPPSEAGPVVEWRGELPAADPVEFRVTHSVPG